MARLECGLSAQFLIGGCSHRATCPTRGTKHRSSSAGASRVLPVGYPAGLIREESPDGHAAPGIYRTQNWVIHKPAARGRGGIVVSQNREAAEAGAAILSAGGNAADAAVATAFALAAVEPWNSGVGGIGFALVLKSGETQAKVVDFGPVAPRRANPADYPLTGNMKRDLFTWPEVVGDRNIHGPLSFCIPSAVAGYGKAEGAVRLQAAVRGAAGAGDCPGPSRPAEGLVHDRQGATSASVLKLYEESARIYLPGGLPPTPPYQGNPDFMVLGNLADTLSRPRPGRP